jgi:hypothetical protein
VKHLSVAGAVWLLIGTGAVPVAAQDVASSFEQLGARVAPGDRIAVFDVTGRRTEGRVGTLSNDRLTLVTPAGPRELTETDVTQIRQRRRDSLMNGALIGAASAGAFFLAMATIVPTGDGGDVIVSSAIRGAVRFVALGAAAGAGIDALITRSQVIYRTPGTGVDVRITPLIGRGRQGAAIAVRF